MIKVNVEINNKLWNQKIKKPKEYFAKKLKKVSQAIELFKKKNITFTILLTDSSNIQKLNKKFTDVLSFPFFLTKNLNLIKSKNLYIGDIALSYEFIKSESKKKNFFLKFDQAWIHGLLHLIGYDHIKDKDYNKMQKVEKRIVNSINY